MKRKKLKFGEEEVTVERFALWLTNEKKPWFNPNFDIP